ncbi:MAG TPA: biotin--[acetyl-CoA-carboxylase] ligase [Acidobacteriota bacterium]|nr:biotin--[acetyl-CoA-carboxylase] ligase [Acidobacteriota bacterium]
MPDLDGATELRFRGVPVECHGDVGSTNDEAFRRAAEGAPEGLVVLTAHQRAGRGRLGRPWWDAPGDSVLASVLLRPGIPLARYPLLGMAAACAIAEAAARLVPGERFEVKWPNDVLHGRRKLSGVLAETRVPDASAVPPLVVGFGINVNQREDAWPEEIRPIATSLRAAAGDRAFDPGLVLREVLAGYERYVAFAAAGDADALWEAVRSRLPAEGTPLVVVSSERRVEGTVEGYEPSGALRLRDASGAVHTVAAGEIPLDPGTNGGRRS